MQIPILSGVYTGGVDFRTSYPVNLVPVPKQSGISDGFLRPGDGILQLGTGPGIDRGGINWNGVCYRVMGTKLAIVSSTGTVTVLGDVGGTPDNLVSMDYSFDRLAISSGGKLFYWNGTLTQVTDSDLGTCNDVTWIDGYFMTTDGMNLVVTDLSDPTQINPLKYGSSEVDPDPILGVEKIRNEAVSVGRYSVEMFDNVGGDLFPFQRIEGAQIQKGAIGRKAFCVYMDALGFVGSGRNEAPGIYIGLNGQAQKISTQEIDQTLAMFSESELSQTLVESRSENSHQFLYVHLPDRTLVFDGAASKELGQNVWFVLSSSVAGFAQYRARNFIWVHDKWMCGDPQTSRVGVLDKDTGHHWGEIVRWEFGTQIVYNEGRGAIFYELELVSLTGQVPVGIDPMVTTSYSIDGEVWSQDRAIRAGASGRRKRLVWFQQGHMRNWRIQRFRGDSQAHLSFARLEARIEPLV